MITKIEIDGFKSFSNSQMEFTPLTVIAGTNASGKSNLFDALQLLSSLSSTDLRSAFSQKGLRGEVTELFTLYQEDASVSSMKFAVELLVDRTVRDNWGGEALIKTPRLRYELTISRKPNGRGFEELLVLISRQLKTFLPDYTEVDVINDQANKQFVITLKNESGKEFTSRVLSEGTLRLLTLCILLYDNNYQGLLCFEEPENGIHPFRIKSMVELLNLLATDFEEPDEPLRQVIVNTHSPVLLKYFSRYDNKDCNVSICSPN